MVTVGTGFIDIFYILLLKIVSVAYWTGRSEGGQGDISLSDTVDSRPLG